MKLGGIKHSDRAVGDTQASAAECDIQPFQDGAANIGKPTRRFPRDKLRRAAQIQNIGQGCIGRTGKRKWKDIQKIPVFPASCVIGLFQTAWRSFQLQADSGMRRAALQAPTERLNITKIRPRKTASLLQRGEGDRMLSNALLQAA